MAASEKTNMGKLLEKLGKLFIIAIITIGIIVATVLFRLPHQTNEAHAVVWELFDGVIREVPRYFRSYEGRGEVREVEINGNKLFYTNTMTSDKAIDVIDHYYEMYKKPEFHLLSEKTRQIPEIKKRPDVIRFFERIDDVVNEKLPRVYRKDGNGYGFVGYIDMGNKDFFDHYIENGRDFAKTGKLDKIGVGKVVMAIEDTLGKTTVLNFWTGSDFNFQKFMSSNDHDAYGEDIPDVPRPVRAVRTLSTKETDSLAKVRMAAYRADCSKQSAIFAYLGAMRDAGWTKSKTYEEADVKSGVNSSMLFMKENREVNISVREDNENHIMIIVMERRFKG